MHTTPHHTTPHHTTPHHTTPHHTTPHHTTPHHTTPHHTTPHHTTPHHTTPHPEYSPALPMGWVPGAKPPTTGPGHHPQGWCTNSVGCTHTPTQNTTPNGARGPLVPAARALGKDQQSLERTAGTTSPSSPPQRPCPTHRGPLQSPGMRPPRALASAPPTAAPARAPVPPSMRLPQAPPPNTGPTPDGGPCPNTPCHPPPMPNAPPPATGMAASDEEAPEPGLW